MSDFRSHAKFSIANSSRHIQKGSLRICCSAALAAAMRDKAGASLAALD